MAERLVNIGTDVATLLVFHPQDLSHREHSPIGWYGYDFAYRRESAGGRLIAWGTGGDGGYLVRLTTGSLSDAERQHVYASRDFPFVVRHGRVLVDNSDALPGHGQMSDPDTLTDQWFDVPNGSYRVTVHALDAGQARELPDYVIAFLAVDGIDDIGVERLPPLLEPLEWDSDEAVPDGATAAESGAEADRQRAQAERPFLWKAEPLESEELAAFPMPPEAAIVPGGSLSLPVSDEVAEHFYPRGGGRRQPPGPVLAPVLEPGRLGLATEVHGRSWMIRQGSHISIRAITLVRIIDVRQGDQFATVRVEPVDKPDMTLDEAAAAAFRSRLLSAIKPSELSTGVATAPGFEIERLETLFSAEAVTGWALTHLPMPAEKRIALWAAPVSERINGIEALLGA
jgi:hypothetical protein